MTSRYKAAFAILIVGGLYWQLVCLLTGSPEPWDAAGYWHIWYPGSLALAAIAGLRLKRRGWSAGAIITFAQAPVMWVNAGYAGPFWAVGVVMLCMLAVPAVAISALAGGLAVRHGGAA